MPEKRTEHLTIFLAKEKYTIASQIIHAENCEPPLLISISGFGEGSLYLKRTHNITPKWAELFSPQIDPNTLKTSGISAAFLLEVDGRVFIVTFGQGGRFLLRSDVFEDRFGLLTALNSVDAESFRVIDKQSLDAIESHTRTQSGQGSSADQFGLDVEQDMLKAIVGAPKDHSLGSRMAGTDSLSVSVKMGLGDLPMLLRKYKEKFDTDLTGTPYQWVNNLSMVKSTSSLMPKLESKLLEKFHSEDYQNLWLSIPEIIDWANVAGFLFTNGARNLYPDINLPAFLKTVDKGQKITIELLKQREVSCADADHKRTLKSWTIFKCLYGEIDLDGERFILNDGKWFNVNLDFVARTDLQFSSITRSAIELPAYCGGGEGVFNSTIAKNFPNRFFLLDAAEKIMHGGGHGQVEVCDLLSIDRELIHVKMYGKSSVFSHLFAQGYVSGQLIQSDEEFRGKIEAKLKGPFKGMVTKKHRPKDQEFSIVYAVISDDGAKDLYLPFFSRVNINNTARILKGYGYRVELLKIGVDPLYSKKVIARPALGK